jgi:hypothetical protein
VAKSQQQHNKIRADGLLGAQVLLYTEQARFTDLPAIEPGAKLHSKEHANTPALILP